MLTESRLQLFEKEKFGFFYLIGPIALSIVFASVATDLILGTS